MKLNKLIMFLSLCATAGLSAMQSNNITSRENTEASSGCLSGLRGYFGKRAQVRRLQKAAKEGLKFQQSIETHDYDWNSIEFVPLKKSKSRLELTISKDGSGSDVVLRAQMIESPLTPLSHRMSREIEQFMKEFVASPDSQATLILKVGKDGTCIRQ